MNPRFSSDANVRIDTYLPREGPETIFEGKVQQIFIGIAPYLPREGPETLPPTYAHTNKNGIDIYLPREGPETVFVKT